MSTLYINTPGTKIHRHENRLIARLEGEELASVPLEWLDLVVVQGRCEVTAASVGECLRRKIPIAYLDEGGEFLGRLEPVSLRLAALQRAQLLVAQAPARCLGLARQVVVAKLRNARVALRGWGEFPGNDEAMWALENAIHGAERAESLDALRGYEGSGAATYFQGIAALIGADWGFAGRCTRPARDPLNAVLNYAYTLLHVRIRGVIAAVGLNPYLGFYHVDREGHAALASDLQEEWRAAVVDRMVIELLRAKAFSLADFDVSLEGASRITRDGRQILARAWESRLEMRATLPSTGVTLPLRVALLQQAQHFVRHLREPDETPYQPMEIH